MDPRDGVLILTSEVFMNKVIFAVLLVIGLAGCYNTSDAEKAARAHGFSDVKVHGHGWFACAKDDFYATKFTATNARGEKVEGVVCSGLFFKNSTVRF